MLILSSFLKIQVDKLDQFFFSHLLPGGRRIIVGIVISHQFNGVLHRDFMLFHEVSKLQVCLDLPSGFCGFPPGEAFSLRWGSSSSSLSRISPMFGQVAPLLVINEALAVSHVLCSFTGGEINLVDIHGVGVRASGSSSWLNITVSSSSKFPESYHVSVKLSCLVEPLFPFPASPFLAIREGGGSHHDGELLGYSLLESVYQDAVVVDSAAHLCQLEGGGVLVKVSIELVHTEGINSLVGSVLDILQDKCFFKCFA